MNNIFWKSGDLWLKEIKTKSLKFRHLWPQHNQTKTIGALLTKNYI